jgi:hypothetical protein
MPSPLFANTAEFEIRYLIDLQRVENTLYFLSSTPYSLSTLQDACNALSESWITNIMPLLADGLFLIETFGRDLSVGEGAEATTPAPSNTHGAFGVQVSNNVSFCVSFRSGVAGRSNRGRNYLPGIPAAALATANTFDTGWVGDILSAYSAVATDMSDLGFQHVIASRYHNGVVRPSGQTQNVTSYLAVDNIVDSQRRRLPGRGN